MNDQDKTREQLVEELQALRARLAALAGAGDAPSPVGSPPSRDAECSANGSALEREEALPAPPDQSTWLGDEAGAAELRHRSLQLDRLNRALLTEINVRKRFQERLQLCIERMPIGCIIADRHSRIAVWNPAAERILGYAESEVLGKRTQDVLVSPPDGSARDGVKRLHDFSAVETHALHENVTKDGRTLVCEWQNTPLKTPGGEVIGVLGMFQDVTARKCAEEALRAERNFNSAVLDIVGALVIVVDPEGRIVRFNRACETTIGYTADEVRGRHFGELFLRPEELAKAQAAFAELRDGKYPSQLENSWTTKGGGHRLITWSNTVLLGADGSLEYVIGTGIDVTDRRRAEQRMELQHATTGVLARARNYSGAIPEALATICRIADWDLGLFWTVDAQARLLRCLASWTAPERPVPAFQAQIRALTFEPGVGLPGRVWESRRPAWITDLAEETHFRRAPAAQRDGLRAVLAFPILLDGEVTGVIELFRRTCWEVDAGWLSALTTLGKQIGGFIERKRAEEKLGEYAGQLQTLSRRLLDVQEIERRHLARELHDEIGQHLTGLHFALENGARLQGAALRDCLDRAQGSIRELTARVRDLSLRLRPTMLDDLGLLPALVWQFDRYTAQTGVEVVFEHTEIGARFPPEVETAGYRIVQEALTNVARHAGVREARVRIWLDDNTLQLQVEDRGAGFDPEAAPSRGASSGLSGMKERAVLLGGRLTVESSPGAGTRLTAELPIQGLQGDDTP